MLKKCDKQMKKVNIVHLKMVREASFFTVPKVESPDDAHRLFREFIGSDVDRELFVLLCLDTKNRPTAVQVIAIGTLDSTLIHPREVFKTAILANSANIICAHWHPSGDPEPSPEDVASTKRLIRTGKIVGIGLLDHLILGAGNDYLSFKERDLMTLANNRDRAIEIRERLQKRNCERHASEHIDESE